MHYDRLVQGRIVEINFGLKPKFGTQFKSEI